LWNYFGIGFYVTRGIGVKLYLQGLPRQRFSGPAKQLYPLAFLVSCHLHRFKADEGLIRKSPTQSRLLRQYWMEGWNDDERT